jgi:polyhydroxybutyrate depolymerase
MNPRALPGLTIFSLFLLPLAIACDLTGDSNEPEEATVQATAEPTSSPPEGAAPPDDCGLSADSGSRDVNIGSAPTARTFRLHVPADYDPNHAYPVLLNFHGAGGSASGQQEYSGFTPAADEVGFIELLPQADPSVRTWRLGPDFAVDLSFIVEVMDEVQRQLCIDPNRVFATGFSDGATFANALACAGFRLAGIAVVSAGGSRSCRPFQPIPAIGFHGTADDILRYESVDPERWAAGWAELNGCGEVAETERPQATILTYRDCVDGAPVVFLRLEGAGHQWPGAEPIEGLGETAQVDATGLIVEFFGLTG